MWFWFLRAKVAKEIHSHNRNGWAGGILKRYTADNERVIGKRLDILIYMRARRNEFADTRHTRNDNWSFFFYTTT